MHNLKASIKTVTEYDKWEDLYLRADFSITGAKERPTGLMSGLADANLT